MTNDDLIDLVAGLVLFADCRRADLEKVVHTFEEEMFPEGQRVLRQGFAGNNFYLVIEGEATVRIDGQDRATLGRGDFFGEVSVLLGEEPTADVVALRPLRCLVLPGGDLEEFLVSMPRVMFRLLQAEARRLRSTIRWQS